MAVIIHPFEAFTVLILLNYCNLSAVLYPLEKFQQVPK